MEPSKHTLMIFDIKNYRAFRWNLRMFLKNFDIFTATELERIERLEEIFPTMHPTALDAILLNVPHDLMQTAMMVMGKRESDIQTYQSKPTQTVYSPI